jgi:hypothetical protein
LLQVVLVLVVFYFSLIQSLSSSFLSLHSLSTLSPLSIHSPSLLLLIGGRTDKVVRLIRTIKHYYPSGHQIVIVDDGDEGEF